MKTRTSSPVRLVTSRWVPQSPFYLHFIFGCSAPILWSGFNYCCMADPWPPLHQDEPHLLTLTVVPLLTFPISRSSALSLLSCLQNKTLFLYPKYKSPHSRCSVNSFILDYIFCLILSLFKIKFGCKNNEIVAEIISSLSEKCTSPALFQSLFFSVFTDRSFNLALSCSRWLLSHCRLLITTQIPVNYQMSSSVFAT